MREIGTWVSDKVEGFGSPGKSKALSRRSMGQRLWLWVRGVIWALGSPAKSKIGLWVCGFMARSLWVAGKVEARGSLAMGSLSLSLSLSLFVFQKMIFEGKIKMEIILHQTHGQTEKHFQKMYFPCATKHPHLRKSISENHFHPKQTQPKASPYSLAT